MIEKRVTIASTTKTVAGWEFAVKIKIKDLDTGETQEHNLQIQLDDTDYARLTDRTITPEEMITKSANFLLGRESAGRIPRRFNLMDISKHYPDYEEMIKP